MPSAYLPTAVCPVRSHLNNTSIIYFIYPLVSFIFSRGYASVETTIVMGQNVQLDHSLRCKCLADNMESLVLNQARARPREYNEKKNRV